MGTAVGVGVDPAGAIERVRVDQGAQLSNAERPMVQAPPSFKILRTLGVGGQGQVYLAIHTSTPQGFVGASVRCPVALKVLEKEQLVHSETRKKLAREISIISRLNHPGACPLVLPAFQDESRFYVPMPYFPGGCLSSHLGGGARFSEQRAVWAVLFPLMDAVAFCHSRGIIHRDIKSENLLVKLDGQSQVGLRASLPHHRRQDSGGRFDVREKGNGAEKSLKARTPMGGRTQGGSGKLSQIVGVVLTDFGLAVDTTCGQRPKTPVGTLDCMSPEMLCACSDPEERALCPSLEWGEGIHCACPSYSHKPSRQSAQVDIWAIGVLTYELITGRSPFEYRGKRGQAPPGSAAAAAAWFKERTEVRSRILTMDASELHFPSYVTAEARDFIVGALHKDPTKRSDLWTLLHHPWIVRHVVSREMDERTKPWLACKGGVSARVSDFSRAGSIDEVRSCWPLAQHKSAAGAEMMADGRVRGGQNFAGLRKGPAGPTPAAHLGPDLVRPVPMRLAPSSVEAYSNGHAATGHPSRAQEGANIAQTSPRHHDMGKESTIPSELDLDIISSALESAQLEPARKRMHDNAGRTRDTRGAKEAHAEDMAKSKVASLAVRAGGEGDTDESVRNGKSREGSVDGKHSGRFSSRDDVQENSDGSGLDNSLSGGKRCLAELELMGLGGTANSTRTSRPPAVRAGRRAARASGITHDVSLRGQEEAITILRNVPSITKMSDEVSEGSTESKKGKKGKGMWHKAMKMMGAV